MARKNRDSGGKERGAMKEEREASFQKRGKKGDKRPQGPAQRKEKTRSMDCTEGRLVRREKERSLFEACWRHVQNDTRPGDSNGRD